MSIRYVRRGLQVVRVVDATPPVRSAPEPAVDPSAVVAALLAGGRRRAAFNLQGTPQPRGPGRDVPGTDLLRARELAGLSQRQLAVQRGYSRGLIAECEAGRRSVPEDLGLWTRSTLAVYGPPEEGEA